MNEAALDRAPEHRCGRPTARKKPCQGFRLDTYSSCVTHLTADERADYKAKRAERGAFWGPYWQERAALVSGLPACWSWSQPAALLETEQEERLDDVCSLRVLSDWQDGRCAICDCRDSGLVTDHDHDTGLVRGLLCRQCNTNEGMDGRPGTVYGRYRERPPMVMLRLRSRYWDPILREYAKPAPPRRDDWDDHVIWGL